MSSASALRAQVEARLQHRIPAALSPMRPAALTLPSGIPGIEIPLGRLVEICAPEAVSSGCTTLLLSIIAQITGQRRCCALVDAADCFDPYFASAAGVDLERLLWVRCAARQKKSKSKNSVRNSMKPLEQAFKAADLVLQAAGFALIVVDLGRMEEALLHKVPLTTWFRFARAVENSPSSLIFLTPAPMARSCAALSLTMHLRQPRWSAAANASPPHARLLENFEIEAEVLRARKPAGSVPPVFSAKAIWA
jgi:hypothetical protein